MYCNHRYDEVICDILEQVMVSRECMAIPGLALASSQIANGYLVSLATEQKAGAAK